MTRAEIADAPILGRTSTLLHHTAENNHVLFKLLLQKGVDVNFKDRVDMTALHYAAEKGDFSAAEILLDHGADINAKYHEKTSLRLALENNHFATARMLLEHGADVNDKYYGTSLLWEAVENKNLEMVRLLLTYDADVNEKYYSRSLLWKAVEDKNLEMVRLLLTHGADIDIKRYGQTPLQLAQEIKEPEIAELISTYTQGAIQDAIHQTLETTRYTNANTKIEPNLVAPSYLSIAARHHPSDFTKQPPKSSRVASATSSLDPVGLVALGAIAAHSSGLLKTKEQKEWEKWSKLEWKAGDDVKRDIKNLTKTNIGVMLNQIASHCTKLVENIEDFQDLSNEVFDTYGIHGKENYRLFLRTHRDQLLQQQDRYDAISDALLNLEKQIDTHLIYSQQDVDLLEKKVLEAAEAIEKNKYKNLTQEEIIQRNQEEIDALKKDLAGELKSHQGIWGGRFGSYTKQRDLLVEKLVEGYEKLAKNLPDLDRLDLLDHIFDTVTGKDNTKHVQEILQKGELSEINNLADTTLEIVAKERKAQEKHKPDPKSTMINPLSSDLGDYSPFKPTNSPTHPHKGLSRKV